MVLAIEWRTQGNFTGQFVSGDLIDNHKERLLSLNSPNIFVESHGAKSIIDEENKYQYLVYEEQNNSFIYITR